ncbi:glutathione S-transferase family protein [Pelagibius sp.]|uniref:glutathione S-transferase family protein n=1 Tax=Pelagibius sp. TaxID=1931238 RepID=UPI002639C2C0|nr:glutathione S-transferase family protein [Pelagibius sp.]
MPNYTMILGNKSYSSWALRGWLIAKLAGIDFEEEVILLRKPDMKAKVLRHSPAGLVPVLIEDGEAIWDSLAIGEHLAERYPERQLWPVDPAARSLARCVVAEMHSGFRALRMALPMDLRRRYPDHPLTPEVAAEVARIQAIWRDCRERFGDVGGGGGGFLFGEPTIADAFYAPVVTRFRSFEVTLEDAAEEYCATIMAWPAMQEWVAAAAEETEVIEFL